VPQARTSRSPPTLTLPGQTSIAASQGNRRGLGCAMFQARGRRRPPTNLPARLSRRHQAGPPASEEQVGRRCRTGSGTRRRRWQIFVELLRHDAASRRSMPGTLRGPRRLPQAASATRSAKLEARPLRPDILVVQPAIRPRTSGCCCLKAEQAATSCSRAGTQGRSGRRSRPSRGAWFFRSATRSSSTARLHYDEATGQTAMSGELESAARTKTGMPAIPSAPPRQSKRGGKTP